MQENTTRRSNKSRTEETRAALLMAARQLFLEKGYAETGTPEIVKTANVTRGALYHHFKDKTDLFRAVIHNEAMEVARQIKQETEEETHPEKALKAGAEAYFSAMSKNGRARLLLIEGPSVLGLQEMKQIDLIAGGKELGIGLDEALSSKTSASVSIEILTELLSATFDRAALAISEGGDNKEYKKVINLLLTSLLKY